MMARRQMVNQVGLLDDRYFMYAEDVDWCKRSSDAGWDNAFCPEAKIIHYGGASSSVAPVRYYIEMQRANVQYFAKHHGRCGVLIFRLILFVHHVIRLPMGVLQYLADSSSRAIAALKIKRNAYGAAWALCVLPEKWETGQVAENRDVSE
jgi:GT2 family glycosyltransferase